MLTLGMVPVVYSLLDDARNRGVGQGADSRRGGDVPAK